VKIAEYFINGIIKEASGEDRFEYFPVIRNSILLSLFLGRLLLAEYAHHLGL